MSGSSCTLTCSCVVNTTQRCLIWLATGRCDSPPCCLLTGIISVLIHGGLKSLTRKGSIVHPLQAFLNLNVLSEFGNNNLNFWFHSLILFPLKSVQSFTFYFFNYIYKWFLTRMDSSSKHPFFMLREIFSNTPQSFYLEHVCPVGENLIYLFL